MCDLHSCAVYQLPPTLIGRRINIRLCFCWGECVSSSFSLSQQLPFKEQAWVGSMKSESTPKSTASQKQEAATNTRDMCSQVWDPSASSACSRSSSSIPPLPNWGTCMEKLLSAVLFQPSLQLCSCLWSTITIFRFRRIEVQITCKKRMVQHQTELKTLNMTWLKAMIATRLRPPKMNQRTTIAPRKITT